MGRVMGRVWSTQVVATQDILWMYVDRKIKTNPIRIKRKRKIVLDVEEVDTLLLDAMPHAMKTARSWKNPRSQKRKQDKHRHKNHNEELMEIHNSLITIFPSFVIDVEQKAILLETALQLLRSYMPIFQTQKLPEIIPEKTPWQHIRWTLVQGSVLLKRSLLRHVNWLTFV